jgi:hypothetical protein
MNPKGLFSFTGMGYGDASHFYGRPVMGHKIKVSQKKYEALKKAVFEASLAPEDRLSEAEMTLCEKARALVAPSFSKAERKAQAAATKLYLGS